MPSIKTTDAQYILNLRRDSTYTRSEPPKISYLLITYMGTNQSAINVSYLKGFAKFMAELVPALPNMWIKQKKKYSCCFL